jgi:hypothetical protein
LGYNLPREVLEKKNIERMRVYFQVINPTYWTRFNGMDPEYNSNTFIDDVPNLTFAIGANIGF